MNRKFFRNLVLVLSLTGSASLVWAQEPAINLTLAAKYLAEANDLCSRDRQGLWGLELCGPTLFVDMNTREVVANQADAPGVLKQKDGLFVGKWPLEMNISNTAVDWGGKKWTMVMWPLPTDIQDRTQLLLHELFHRVQEQLHLPGLNPPNSHLDSRDGRVWLQLEWRALANALFTRGPNRKTAIVDALTFRAYRHSLFPAAAKEERELEINEGLAEYTGMKLSAGSNADFAIRASCTLRQARFRPTFVRSFAYASGPAYGALLDESGKNWRKTLQSGSDLGMLLRGVYGVKLPRVSEALALKRAGEYSGESLIASETERENNRQELMAKYRSRFVEQPALDVPLTDKAQYSFNPNNLIPFGDNGTIYPTMRVTDEWGILEVSDGALMIREAGKPARIVIAIPKEVSERPLTGPGWKLQLKEGWELRPGMRKDSLVVMRKLG